MLRGSERQKVVLLFGQGLRVSGVEMQAALEPFGGPAGPRPARAGGLRLHPPGRRQPRPPRPGRRRGAGGQEPRRAGDRRRRHGGQQAAPGRPAPTVLARCSPSRRATRGPTTRPASCCRRRPAPCSPRCPPRSLPGRPDRFVLGGSTSDDVQSRTVMQDAAAPLVGRASTLRALVSEATTRAGRLAPAGGQRAGRRRPGQDPHRLRAGPGAAGPPAGGRGDRAARARAAGQRHRRDLRRAAAPGAGAAARRARPTAAASC